MLGTKEMTVEMATMENTVISGCLDPEVPKDSLENVVRTAGKVQSDSVARLGQRAGRESAVLTELYWKETEKFRVRKEPRAPSVCSGRMERRGRLVCQESQESSE